MMYCRSPILSVSQWRSQKELGLVASSLGLALIVILLVSWLISIQRRAKSKNTEVLVTIYAISSMATTLTLLISSSQNPEDIFCHSNTVPITYKDGFTFCSFQSVVITYSSLVNNLAWLMLAVDLFMKITLGIKEAKKFLVYVIPIILILPAISMSVLLVNHGEGYTVSTQRCFYANINGAKYQRYNDLRDDQDIAFFFIPMTIFTSVGSLLMIVVVYSTINIMRDSMSNFWVVLNLLKTPFAFVLFSDLVWLSLIVSRFQYFRTSPAVRTALKSWIQCIFYNFDEDNLMHFQICGHRPSNIYAFGPIQWQFLCLCGQSIFMASIYLTSFYSSLLYSLYGKTWEVTRKIASGVTLVVRRTSFTNYRRLAVAPMPMPMPIPTLNNQDDSPPNNLVASNANNCVDGNRNRNRPPLASGYDPADYEIELVAHSPCVGRMGNDDGTEMYRMQLLNMLTNFDDKVSGWEKWTTSTADVNNNNNIEDMPISRKEREKPKPKALSSYKVMPMSAQLSRFELEGILSDFPTASISEEQIAARNAEEQEHPVHHLGLQQQHVIDPIIECPRIMFSLKDKDLASSSGQSCHSGPRGTAFQSSLESEIAIVDDVQGGHGGVALSQPLKVEELV